MSKEAPAIPWKRWLGPLPGRGEARAISWLALAAGVILCVLSLIRGFAGERFMGRTLGGDYAEFYVAGTILNHFEPYRVYDLSLQSQLYQQSVPDAPADQAFAVAHTPFLLYFFRPLAQLPYLWSYCLWLALSLAIYCGTLRLLWTTAGIPASSTRTATLLALSWAPFLMETWIGGQVSILAFAALTLALWFESRGQPFLAGLALAFLSYKVTLLLIPAFLLLAGKRWRMLSGAAAGAAGLGMISFLLVGAKGMHAWFNTLLFYKGLTGMAEPALRRHKYVDLPAFLQMLAGHGGGWTRIAGLTLAGALLVWLAMAWKKSAGSAKTDPLLWAATIPFLLTLNAYLPIYETILLVVAAALLADAVPKRYPAYSETLTGWLVLLYLVPWITQAFAELIRFQLFTPVLVAFGLWTLWLARSAETAALAMNPAQELSVE